MTGLTSVHLGDFSNLSISMLTQYCNKLTMITVTTRDYPVSDMFSLCHANPLLQELWCSQPCGITDTILIELIHACPHLRTLYFLNVTDITDIGILAYSEQCPQLQWLNVSNCKQITEAAVLQLLQRCRKLTRLEVSSSSLSEETWIQLDKNTQKRVIRC